MSWVEKGKVVSADKRLVVRLPFGKLVSFTNFGDYKNGDSISIIVTSCGNTTILESEHSPTANTPPKLPKLPKIAYGDLEYLEDLG